MIQIEAPDGSIIEFPDGTPDNVIEQVMANEYGGPSQELSTGGYMADILKSAGAGFGRGAVAALGMVGDAQEMVGNASAGLAGMLGAGPAAQEMMRRGVTIPGVTSWNAPTTERIRATVDPGKALDYEPQSTAGSYARTMGEFAPGAVVPGGIARKAASVIVPAIASETAGQATEGSSAEPYARFAGALAGGVAAAGRSHGATKEMLKNAPSIEQVRRRTDALYAQLDAGGVKYDANAYSQMLHDLSGKLTTYRATKAPMTADTVKYLSEFHGKSPSFRDLEDMRQEATSILRERNASDTDKKAARIVIDALTGFGKNSPLITNGTIAPDRVAKMAEKARELARRNILAKQIGEMKGKAQHYVSGDESGLRNQFGSYLRSNKRKGLTEMEKQAFDKVVRREGVMNTLHSQGSRLTGRLAGPSLATGAFLTGGGPLGAALAFALGEGFHLGARKASEMLTRRSVRDALKTVLAGRSAQEVAASATATERQKVAARLLIAAESGRVSATNQ